MVQHDILSQIRQIRKQKKISQADLAERLHIALKTYQNIENGITRIDLERLSQIAEILEVPLSIILHDKHNEQRHEVPEVVNQEKKLYDKIITDKEKYITQLEEHIRFYQQILKESKNGAFTTL
ncbi:Helix-turn-helix [bacterium A37T11]|nr:Helix-turn-helix [bacterium A37T11]